MLKRVQYFVQIYMKAKAYISVPHGHKQELVSVILPCEQSDVSIAVLTGHA